MIRTAGCIITKHNAVLLLHRTSRQDYFFPGGKLEHGETPEQAAVREVREEIGCEVVLGEKVDVLRYTVDGKQYESHLFAATIQSEPQLLEPDKFDHLLWMPLSDHGKYILSPLVRLHLEHMRTTGLRKSP